MTRALRIIVILFLLISCNNPCKEFYDTPVHNVVNEIFRDSLINDDRDFNVLKIMFLQSYIGPEPFLRIINDPFYSEEANNFELDGWIEINGVMVAFYGLDEYARSEEIKPCLNTEEPPGEFHDDRPQFPDYQPRIWRFETDKNGALIYESKSPNAKLLSNKRYE